MARLAILVESRGVDLTAITAFETLKSRLGYSRSLSGLARSDLWAVWCEATGARLDDLGRRLVEGTSVFVNPNKHRWRVWSEGMGEAFAPDGGAWILVWNSEETEGRRALAELRGAGFGAEVTRISKATLWTSSFGDASGRPGLDLAEEIAVAVRRDRGLLANPHMHEWTCGEGALSMERAVSCLDSKR
jgi:hypothetical protein